MCFCTCQKKFGSDIT